MPYPQFLFSPTFIDAKLEKLGIFDLGQKRSKLQYLNRLKPSQFSESWNGPKFEIAGSNPVSDEEHLGIIIEYPECFCGRGLAYQDVTCSNVVSPYEDAHKTCIKFATNRFATDVIRVMLIVVLRRDGIAILRFSASQRQVSLVFFAGSESHLAGFGARAISSALADLQTGALAQLSFCYFAFLAL
jgi:hypothetical protein